jgi:hypothetical protein
MIEFPRFGMRIAVLPEAAPDQPISNNVAPRDDHKFCCKEPEAPKDAQSAGQSHKTELPLRENRDPSPTDGKPEFFCSNMRRLRPTVFQLPRRSGRKISTSKQG